jgi:DNA-binding beta-propeller fold protein YncE
MRDWLSTKVSGLELLICVLQLIVHSLPPAAAHGEGGSTLREGAFDINPVGAGGTGYAEAQFPLLKGDGLQHQWKVNSPAWASVDFNLHGHDGSKVEVFNRSSGASGGGSMIAPSGMSVALMWRSNATSTINVSYAVQLQHAPDLYSSAFFTANLAGLMLLFAAVWELSIRGRKRVEEATNAGRRAGEMGEKDSTRTEAAGDETERPGREKPGFFSDWRRRAVLYGVVLVLCFAPMLSFFARGEGPSGTEPQQAPWAAIIGHRDSKALTIVDPVRNSEAGEVVVSGIVDGLAVSPVNRLLYVVTRSPDRLEILDGTAFVSLRRADLPRAPGWGPVVTPDNQRVLVSSHQSVDVFDARNATHLGTLNVQDAMLIGFTGAPYEAALLSRTPQSVTVRIFDLGTLVESASIQLPKDAFAAWMSPSGSHVAVQRWTPGLPNQTVEMRRTLGGQVLWNANTPLGTLQWLPDGSAVTVNARFRILAIDAADGSVEASLPTSEWVGHSVVSGASRLLYFTSDNGTKVTVVSTSTWQIVGSFEAGDPGGTHRELLLDSTGSYALVTAQASGELVTLHDKPDVHYHSRLRVGGSPTLCALLEPPTSR